MCVWCAHLADVRPRGLREQLQVQRERLRGRRERERLVPAGLRAARTPRAPRQALAARNGNALRTAQAIQFKGEEKSRAKKTAANGLRVRN